MATCPTSDLLIYSSAAFKTFFSVILSLGLIAFGLSVPTWIALPSLVFLLFVLPLNHFSIPMLHVLLCLLVHVSIPALSCLIEAHSMCSQLICINNLG